MFHCVRPSTAAGGSPYSGSLSARRAKQMGLATMDSLTLKAAIAAALQYRGDQVSGQCWYPLCLFLVFHASLPFDDLFCSVALV